ncbi:MAG: alpha-ketoglutarate-dependent dioxygenase AlkB [Leptolyngbyaceae cyanobacterium MO_188.B28]|nr:alpha-ketoglutarate-dependent dioxygenase AlkB [Leptolyngbyaceae cyanobacterium MO_188.B28]
MYTQLNLLENSEFFSNTESQSQFTIEQLSISDADLTIYPSLFSKRKSDELFTELYNHIDWQQEFIQIYNKSIPIPRLTAWHGDKGTQYTYSNIEMEPLPWTLPLLEIKRKIEPLSGVQFNSVLLNLYRDGKDSVAWHSDDEPELGVNPVIGSVSFGGSRRFVLKHRHKRSLKQDIELAHGDFLVMRGTTQHFWRHQIPKTKKPVDPRINLTFRTIKQ